MADSPHHTPVVRLTHWLTTIAFLFLLATGIEIILPHPRLYWGEYGNVNTTPLFQLPIPSSRAIVHTGYNYVLRDENGWGRALHFQSAWLLLFAAAIYILSGKFRRLMPGAADLAALPASLRSHLRFEPLDRSYNPLQKFSYAVVVFLLFPFIIWTGLAMSPTFAAFAPSAVSILGGQQSARTIHFFLTIFLFVFLIVHVAMLFFAGFRTRMRSMLTGDKT